MKILRKSGFGFYEAIVLYGWIVIRFIVSDAGEFQTAENMLHGISGVAGVAVSRFCFRYLDRTKNLSRTALADFKFRKRYRYGNFYRFDDHNFRGFSGHESVDQG